MRINFLKLLFLIFLVPSMSWGDSESTIGGKTAESHIIQNNSTSLRPRPYLNILTTGTTCTDSGGKTVCDFTALGGGSGNVGIGTPNFVPVYVGVSTLGTSSIVNVSGNVGIGTVSPANKLHVLGTTILSGTTGLDVDNTVSTAQGSNVSFMAQLNNTITDYSNSAITLTNHGPVTFSTTYWPWSMPTAGYSAYFPNDASKYLSAPQNNSAFGFTGDFTIEFYMYKAATEPSYQAPVATTDMFDGTNGDGWGFEFNDNDIGYFAFSKNGANPTYISGGAVFTSPASYYIVVFRKAGTITFCSNGSSVGTASYSGTIPNLTNPLQLGLDVTSAKPFNGYVSGVRISQVAQYASCPSNPTTAFANTAASAVLNWTDTNGSLTMASAVAENTTNTWTLTNNGVRSLTVDSAGNIGIGTTKPPQVLYVAGTMEGRGFKMNASPTNGYVLTTDGNGVGTWQAAAAGGASGWTLGASNVGISTTNNVGIGTTNTTTAALSVMNGNVGIGTWIPTGALDIKTGNNTLIENGNLGIGVTSPTQSLETAGQILIDTNQGLLFRDANSQIFSYTAGGLEFYTNGGRSIIDSTGNFGIGQTSSTQKLDVNGEVLIDSSHALNLRDTTAQIFSPSAGQIELYTNGPRTLLDTNGNLGIGTITPLGGLVVMTGNVGIGTWKPAQLFQVGAGTNFQVSSSSVITLNSSSAAITNGGAGGGSNLTLTAGASSTSHLDLKATSGTGSGESIRFLVGTNGGTEAMRVAGSNIGIGTTIPDRKFTLVGNVGISTTGPSEISTGFDGKGSTSCICTQFKSGICVAGSCS